MDDPTPEDFDARLERTEPVEVVVSLSHGVGVASMRAPVVVVASPAWTA